MFLIDDLFLAPVKGVIWLGEKIREVAINQVYDPNALMKALEDLEQRWVAGEVNEEEFRKQQEEILAAIEIARQFRGG